jgi:hypothetical protein
MISNKNHRKLAIRLTAILGAALLASSVPATTAFAGTADNGGWWQTWAGLYVGTYYEVGNGDIKVNFLNVHGEENLSWTYQGTVVCADSSWLVLSKDHPQRDGMIKALIAAGLSQRPVYALLQPIDGVCYLKQIRVEFRKAVD